MTGSICTQERGPANVSLAKIGMNASFTICCSKKKKSCADSFHLKIYSSMELKIKSCFQAFFRV